MIKTNSGDQAKMTTKKTVQDSVNFLKTFCHRTFTNDEQEALVNAFLVSFKAVPDKIFKDAVFAYVDNEEYFPPKPTQLKKYIKDYQDSRHDQGLIERFICSQCGERVSAIVEKRCFDCAGISGVDRETAIQLPEAEKSNFVMEGRRQCQECGKISLCIKEPREAGMWQCQSCYTGMTKQEIAGQFRQLWEIMAGKRPVVQTDNDDEAPL
jgi:hypothetical protein